MIEYTHKQKNQFFKKSTALVVAGALLCSIILPPYAFTYQRGYLSFVEEKSAENHNMRERSNLIGNSREARRILLKDSIPHGGAEVISDAMKELFVAPYREFLDTFNPVQFFKSHREQTLGQAIGILLIWGAMVAAMIGAPFGIDFLLSGSPTNHLGFTLLSSFIGSLSIVAGIRLNHLKENEDQLNQLKQTSSQLSGLKQQRSALNVVVQEVIHINKVIQTSYKPNRTEKIILSIAYLSYPVNVLSHHLFNLISNLTRPLGKWRLDPLTKARVGEDTYNWVTREQGIENVRDGIRKNRPDLLERYENLNQLIPKEREQEEESLRNEVYRITSGHFNVWGLGVAMNQRKVPYFHGSHINALIALFPDLNLNPLGFQLDWSSEERGIESVKYILSKEVPHIMQQYERIAELNDRELNDLRNEIYRITSGHFQVWGLGGVMNQKADPYFHGSHIVALMAVFPDLNLNPLGFQLDWSNEERGVESVRYVLSKKIQHIMERYERIAQLNDRELNDLRNEIYEITQGHLYMWGLSGAMNQKVAPYFYGSYINVLIAVFPDLNLNSLGFQLDWSSEEKGIESVRYVLSKEVPHILQQYERIAELSDREIHDLRNVIYGIKQAHIMVWKLVGAVSRQSAPYFQGSYINVFISVFSHLRLGLTLQGFRDYRKATFERKYGWKTLESGTWSVREAIRNNRPDIISRYENLGQLKEDEIKRLKRDIYGITQGHFYIWGIGAAMNRKIAPYFYGSYINVLMAVFPDLNLNPLGFQLDWSSEEKGIESVRYVLFREVSHLMQQYERLEQLNDREIHDLRNEIYRITKGDFNLWGLGAAMNKKLAPYFYGSYINALIALFPDLNLNALGFQLDWSSEEKGIESVKYVLSKEVPHSMQQYERIAQLNDRELNDLRNEIYRITSGHFQVWGLSGAMTEKVAPYFHGSYMNVLIAVFPDLNLNPLRFQLDWSSEERGIESVKYILSKEVPHIMQQYERIAELNDRELNDLRNEIYRITQGHFQVWGLNGAVDRRLSPYFHESYIHALLTVFSHPKLGLTREGFIQRTENRSSGAGLGTGTSENENLGVSVMRETVGDEGAGSSVIAEILKNEESGSNPMIENSGDGDLDSTLMREQMDNRYPGFPLMSEDTRTKALNRGMNPNGWIAQLFFAPHYEFLDTFNPVQFFKSHREQTLGQAIGIVLIWGAMVAAMIGAPFGIDFLLSGNPTNHLSITLLSSFIGSLSIVAGIRLNHLKENEDQLNQLKKTSGSHSELKQQRSALNVVVQEVIHINKVIQTSYKPNRTEKIILSIAYLSYPINVLTHHLFNLISNFTRPLGQWRLAPLTKVGVGVDQYDWAIREQGIENVRDGIKKNRPDLLERYENLNQLSPKEREQEEESLRNEIYGITQGYFMVLGLSSVMNQESAPYFNGSYIDALMLVFPDLNLNPLGFQLDWSSEDRGIESVKYVLAKEAPHILQQYERLDQLSNREIHDLRNEIYRITSGHFQVWGLGGAMDQKVAPYFHGSYMNALMAVFPDLNLNPLGFELDWSSEDRGIESVKYVLAKEVPHTMRQYERIAELSDREIHDLRNEIHGITYGHFKIWGLSSAMDQKKNPYFHGSHIIALMVVFPDLNLNPLGFRLDWSNEDRGIESVKYVLDKEAPHILQQYERITQLNDREVHNLRNEIYGITFGHFKIWGLSSAMDQKKNPYFHGSYKYILVSVFNHPRLGLSLQGFKDYRKATFERKYGWKTPESGIWSVREGIRSNHPDIIIRYENLAQFKKDEIERLKRDIYRITGAHFQVWGLGAAMNQESAPYFYGSYINALMAVFPDLNLNPLGFQLDWSSEEKGIESVRYVLSKEVPQIMKQYERLDQLSDREIHDLRNEIYRITLGYFNIWGLVRAMNQKAAPYFYGSYMNVLIAVFPDLNLNPLGFQLDWSSEERGIESVKYILSKEVLHIMQQYERLDQLSDREIHDLRNEIYRITQGHFKVWGLDGAVDRRLAPYFHGGYIAALLAVFSHSKLGLTREGFVKRTENAGLDATQMAETGGDEDSDSSVMTESPGNEESGSNLTREDSGTGDSVSPLLREEMDNRYPGSPLMTEDTRSEALKRGMNPNGWITQLFFAPHYEFLDTFNPVRFFKNHSEQTVGQAIGIVLIWGAMVATMIGAPFGIDFLLSGSPTNHLSITLLSSFIGSLSIVAGIRLNHLKENEDQLNQLKKTSGSHSELKQQRSALNVVVQGLIHFNKFIQTSYKPNRTEKIILSIAYLSYPINVLTHHLFNLISNLTRPLGKWRLAPLTQANGTDNKELYYWGTEEQGIKNVKDAINKNEPELLERYAKLDSLGSTAREREKKSLRVKVYKITSAHFQHWGIQRALDKRSAPYFQGSYIRALMVIFPELELEPLDIQLNWSSKEKAIESILYVLLREIPHVVQQYNDLDNFDPAKIEALKNEIYQITSAHFDVWGLGNVTSKKHVPYFNGSYIHALIALFPNLNLDPLGFELDWSSLESGIKSVLYIFKRQVPYLIQDYERFDELTGLELSNLKKEICSITKAHFTSWGLGSAMVQRGAPYFYGSYKNVLISLFPKINLNSLEFQLDWSSEERAIDSMRFVFSSEIPNILRQYDQLEDLSPILIERLKDEIYQISSAHFDVWGLSNATMKKNVPYFNGSYIQALMAVFPDLNLNPLGFQLDWSSKQRAIDSMRFVISRGMPTFIERYENIDGLSAGEVQRLKNEIYSITQGHFVLLGLAKALHRDTVPDFEGSYMKALVELFNHPRLGLSVEGFINFRRTNWQIKYSWRTRDSGIFNIRDALAAYQPALLAKYDRLDSLREEEKNELRNDVYKITQAHFKVWGLSSAVDREKSPYFNGSYIVALMAVFSNLNLNRLGFELDWSSKEKAIESVRYVLSHVMPDLIEQYDHLSNINPHKIRAFRNEIYRITYGHFGLWGLNGAMNQKLVPYFHGSHINVLIALFPKLNLNPLGFKLEWSTKEKGIETIQFIFDREIPSIVQQYERVDQISEDEVEELKNRIYALSEAELKMWGLSRAMHRESAPYFHGSYIEALMAVFPKLDLDPLGFQLDWSTKERALDSIRFVLTHKVPHIMQRYQNIENLNDLELTLLREGIYRIKRAHLLLWKLGAVFSNTYFNDFIELFINLFSHSKLGLTREGFLEKGNGSDDSSGKRVENNSLDNVGNSSSDTSLNDSTDILEPLVQPLQRFKNWQSLRAYYLFVGSWEEGIYRWGGLVGLPFLFSYFGLDFNSGQVLGVVWSSAGFLFSHTIVRWLAKRNSIGWDGWRMELKKDFLSLRSFNALLYNLLFISIISFQPTLVSFALLSVSSFHFTIDMLDAYKKKSLTSQELLSQEIQLIADKLGTSQPELQSLSFDLNLNFSNLVQTLFGVWSKDTKGSELYLVDLTGSRDQSSQIAMLRTIHEIYGLNQNARFILVMDEPKPIEELESILGIKGILSTVSNPEQAIFQTKAILKQSSYAVRLIAGSDKIGIWSNLMDELGKTVRDIRILVLQILDVGVSITIVLPKDKIFNAGIDQWIRDLEGRGRIERNGRELTIQGVELEPPSLKEDHQIHSLFSSQA